MDFFTNAIDVLQTLVIALGGGLCVGPCNKPLRGGIIDADSSRTLCRPKEETAR